MTSKAEIARFKQLHDNSLAAKKAARMTSHEQEQSERRAYLENEKRLREAAAGTGTYFSHAVSDADAIGGRYAAVGKANVVGTTPIPHSNLPVPSWSGQDNAVEQPLGYSVEDMPVVGEPGEVEAAAAILRERENPNAAFLLPALDCAAGVLSATTAASLAVDAAITPAAPLSNPTTIASLMASSAGEPVVEVGAGSPPHSDPPNRAVVLPVSSARGEVDATVSTSPRTFQRRL